MVDAWWENYLPPEEGEPGYYTYKRRGLILSRDHYGRNKRERSRQVDAVMQAIDLKRDPMEMLLSDPTQLYDKDRGKRSDKRRMAGETPEAKAGALLASIYTSREFSDEVQRRSSKAGNIIDVCLDGLEQMAKEYKDERATPSFVPAEAHVKDVTFIRACGLLMNFYKDTQNSLVKQIAGARGVNPDELDFNSMSDDDLFGILSAPIAKAAVEGINNDDEIQEVTAVAEVESVTDAPDDISEGSS